MNKDFYPPTIKKDEETNLDFVPALRWGFLNKFYDALLFVSGLGQNFKRTIIQIANIPNSTKTIIDIGCGTGTQIKILSKKFPNAQIFGVDPDKLLIKNLQKQYVDTNVTPLIATAQSLHFSDKSIEVALSTLTFHHLSTQQKKEAFFEIDRVLTPGGKFILTDWGETQVEFMRYLLLFEKQSYLDDHFKGLIPTYAADAGFELCSSTRVKMTGIWVWVFKKPSRIVSSDV